MTSIPISATLPRSRAMLANMTTTSVPFTFRDGMTMLELLECLKSDMLSLQNDFNDLSGGITNQFNQQLDEIQQNFETTTKQIENTRKELIRLIKDATGEGGIVPNPVYGMDANVGKAIADIYDNTRYYGLFWADYDNMELTAAEYDAVGMTARRYDLNASRVLNPVPGDYGGRDDFWSALAPKPSEPQKNTFLTESAADATYMKLNPTANSFDKQ